MLVQPGHMEGGASKKRMQKDKLPLTLIVTNLETDLPVAMGSL